MTIGEVTEVTDTMKAVRNRVQQETANELMGVECHQLLPVTVAIILPSERDVIAAHGNEAGVGDGNTVGIAAEIGQHLCRACEGRLGIDHPIDTLRLPYGSIECGRIGQAGDVAEELQLALSWACFSCWRNSRRNRRDRTRTGRKKFGRKTTHRDWSADNPPPGTMQWTCG